MSCDPIYKEQYTLLRSEILQSISKQHQITLGGYGLSATILGYILAEKNPRIEALCLIPTVLMAMTALWIVECNRMVRAGYFIAYHLWDKMEEDANHPVDANWDKWIKDSDDVYAMKFSKRQHELQAVVLPGLPWLASILTISVAAYNKAIAWSVLVAVFYMILWWPITMAFLRVSDLSATVRQRSKGQPRGR